MVGLVVASLFSASVSAGLQVRSLSLSIAVTADQCSDTDILCAAAVNSHVHINLPRSSRLQYRDVNILAVTDVHGWLAGGDRWSASSPPSSGTFGDLVSLTARARDAAKQQGKDVFLVDNGDVVDGTGVCVCVCVCVCAALMSPPNHDVFICHEFRCFCRAHGFRVITIEEKHFR